MKYNIVLLVFFIYFAENKLKSHGFRTFNLENGVKTILTLEGEKIVIECRTDEPITYCGFVHPSGKRYSFTGFSLANGHCSMKVNVTQQDAGEWRCHVGKKAAGVEVTQRTLVRVVDQVAAVQPNVSVTHGKSVTLSCVTSKQMAPLRYCRFEPPNGAAFSIDSAVNKSRAILGKYYYPDNKSLDRGDCAVTISKVKYEDVGRWTCGAGLDDDRELTDDIYLAVEGMYSMSTASATGLVVGSLAIVGFLCVLAAVTWKKRRLLGSVEEQREIVELRELGHLPNSPILHMASPRRSRSVPILVVQSPSVASELEASSPMCR